MKKIMFIMVLVLSLPLFFINPNPADCLSNRDIVGFGQVLCCCETYSGGQCCKWVTFCGSFIPGCMCK